MIKISDLEKIKGLSGATASHRLEKYGHNELQSEKNRGFFKILIDVVVDPMFLLLMGAGLIYLALGDIEEALVLLSFVVAVIGLTVYQENKTEKALEALKNLSSPRALVIRDGKQIRIAGRDVVVGDIVLLNEGDRVPADGILLEVNNLKIDESLLTGESVSVNKITGKEDEKISRPKGDNTPFVYSGTLVVDGQAVFLVKTTGIETEMGKIGKLLGNIKDEKTPLQTAVGNIVKIISAIGLTLCVVVVVFYFLTTGKLLNGFLAGLALAMSILPEEFPVILTVFLSLGAWRISKKKVLARKISAVETLGSVSVLCVDKTGTITQNKMTLNKLFSFRVNLNGSYEGSFFDIKENEGIKDDLSSSLIRAAYLASKKEPFDPMEKAIAAVNKNVKQDDNLLELELIREYPISHKLLALSNVYKLKSKSFLVTAKGAPEAIADLCHLNKEASVKLEKNIKIMASEGLRVLGVAKAVFAGENLSEEIHDYEFNFLGLIGFIDPIRPEVPSAIKQCYSAGIKTLMITGDYPETAKTIARQIGLKNFNETITGEVFNQLSDDELIHRIKKVNIFSRMIPEQKLRIIKALKDNGEIVVMTGDGVNDAPALKAAHIGIAMGERGTDVAREAAALVLLDDNFSSLVDGVRVGRRIFRNMRKAMAYTISIHIPIAGLSLIPVVFQWPLILFPVHIVFLELIIDPVCALLFEAEPENKKIMTYPPRDSKKSIFDKKLLTIGLLQGFAILLVTLVVYRYLIFCGRTINEVRAITFSTLIFSNLMLVLSNRSWSKSIFKTILKKNIILWWIFSVTIVILLLVLYIPFLRKLFSFNSISAADMLFAFFASIISIFWFELMKMFRKKIK